MEPMIGQIFKEFPFLACDRHRGLFRDSADHLASPASLGFVHPMEYRQDEG